MIKHKNILTAVAAVFISSSAFAQQTIDNINGTIAIGDSNTVATTKPVPASVTGTAGAIAIGIDPKTGLSTRAENGGVAIGLGTQAVGMQSSVAVGTYAEASGNYGVAIGSNAQAGGYLGTAIGPGAKANYSESVALGGASTASREREVSVGAPGFTRYVSNVTAGTKATDATNLQQVQNIAADTLDSANGYTDQSIANYDRSNKTYINSAVAGGIQQANNYTDSKFEQSKTLAYSGAAMSMASSALVFDPSKDRQIAVGAATVHGKSSIAAGVAWKAGRSLINVRASTGSNGMSGVAGGASWSW
jgi:autotransporter adhesin